MLQDKHVLHLRSNQFNNYPTLDKTISGTPIMDYGEIAINYAADNEFISIKNSNNTLTLFRAWPYIEQVILDNELVTASALTTLKESCGFNVNGEYTPSATSKYISGVATITEALNVLDKNLSQTYTKSEIDSKGYLTEVPSEYITESELDSKGYLTEVPSEYITESELDSKGYLTEVPSEYITESEASNTYATIATVEANERVTASALIKLNESCGFNKNVEFAPSASSNYISGATTITGALNVLDENLSQTYTKSEIDSKGYLTEVPSEYITESELDAKNYATVAQVENKQDTLTAGDGINITDNIISCTLDTSLYSVVTTLPTTGEANKIYLIKSENSGDSNIYVEYGYIENSWEKLGEYKAEIDLSPYLTKSEASNTYATIATVEANELATAAALTTLKESCGFNENAEFVPSADAYFIGESTNVTDALNVLDKNLSQTYTKNEIDSKGYLTEVPSEYITESELNSKGYLTEVPSEYITESELNSKGYLTEVPSEYITESEASNTYATKATVETNELVTASALIKLNESCGFNENAEFVPSTNATYISEATNVTEALNVLDEKLSSPESLIGLNYVKGGYADFIWDTTRFDNTNVNLTQIMYSVTGLKSGDEITVSFDYQISGVDFSSANASISVQSHTQWGYQTFNFEVNQNTSGHHSFTTHITTATTVIESTVMCPYIRLSLIGGDENSIIKISNFTIVKGNKEILNTISKSDRDYHNGFNKVNTLSNISNTKRSVLCSTNVDQSFYLDIYNDLMPNGEEMHILVQNTNTTNNITIAFSTASHYVLMSGSSLTIQPSSWGEINVLRLGHKYYVRSI